MILGWTPEAGAPWFDWTLPDRGRHDGCVNDRSAPRATSTVLLVRFGERPRQLQIAVGVVVLIAAGVLTVNRYAAAATLIIGPVFLLIRFQRRALVIVGPSGPVEIKGWWHGTSLSPADITRAEWRPRGDVASLRLVMGDVMVNCQCVAIPIRGRPRPQDANWRTNVDAMIDAFEDAGVRPMALDPLRIATR